MARDYRHGMAQLSLERRIAQLLASTPALDSLDLTLMEARGAVLAEDVVTKQPWPHFNVCAQAGYAARSADLRAGQTLEVIGVMEAGSRASAAVGPGKVIRVHEGAPVPAVADVILPADSVAVVDNAHIQVRQQVPPRTGILPQGAYAAVGQTLVRRGQVVDERLVGVLAGLGRSRVSVVPRPRVVIATVGSGLIPDGSAPEVGGLFDSINIMLTSAVAGAGGLPYRIGPLREDAGLVASTLDDQLVRADIIVVCGGVGSALSPRGTGNTLVREVLARVGDVNYDEGSIGLGAFGTGTLGAEKTPIVSLPGDPVAAYLLFRILLLPVLASMQGLAAPVLTRLQLAVDVPRSAERAQILLARVDGDGHAQPLVGRRPTTLDLYAADAMIQIPRGDGTAQRGSAVAAQRLGTTTRVE